MNIPRWLTLGAAGWALATAGLAGAKAPAQDQLVYIGMHGSQIHAARFDPRNGTLTMVGVVADHGRATWAVMHPHAPVLYVVDEAGNDGKANGAVLAYRITPGTGALSLIGTADAGGGGTTYLSIDAASATLVAANYGGGSIATFPLAADGAIGPRASLVADNGTGPSPRQKSPHAHGALVAPGGRYVLAADLGADRVFVYPFTASDHAARAEGMRAYEAPPGSGPRHMALTADGRFVYLINELTADLVTLRWDAAAGTLSAVDQQPTRLPGGTGPSSGSEIAVSGDGRFLYAGNRTDNTLLVYALDRASGKPGQVQRIAAGGAVPWSFTLSPDGHWLLVANEQSDHISVFARDPRTGTLTDTGHGLDTPKPVNITFATFR